MDNLTPREIVSELDKFIIGQKEAKNAVAIAIRNRWRRLQLSREMQEEVTPKNIIMIGPTGVGKTEIARRLAQMIDAPFIKVEASKYTEVGYHGRDVESMIRDLTKTAFSMVYRRLQKEHEDEAKDAADHRVVDCLIPTADSSEGQDVRQTKEKFLSLVQAGELDDREVEISVQQQSSPYNVEVFSNAGLEEMGVDFQQMFDRISPKQSSTKRTTVKEARKVLFSEELEKLIDESAVSEEAVDKVQNSGMIFIDELDKIATGSTESKNIDVSRAGVQRDLLPIVEGSTVWTRYGMIRTDHILFVAAGAFHSAKPSDLIPELQGRFPIRVELNSLKKDDFKAILTTPKNALIKQYKALLATDSVELDVNEGAIDEIAEYCVRINEKTQDIGARRLHTIMEKVLEKISFEAPERQGECVKIDKPHIRESLDDLAGDEEVSRYIL